MYGLIQPYLPELRVWEAEWYRSIYCGVCRALKTEFGEIPRFTLSYEAALLALMWLSLEDAPICTEKRVCVLHPLIPHPVSAEHDTLRHAARMSVLLAYEKCEDEIRDGRGIAGKAGKIALNRAYAKAASSVRRETLEVLRKSREELEALERENSADSDRAADTAGRMLSAVLTDDKSTEPYRETLSWLGYHMGRWLYLADALMDESEDEKKGNYNPVLAAPDREEKRRILRESAEYSASQAAAAMDLLDWHQGQGIVENVIARNLPLQLNRRKDERPVDGSGCGTKRH